MNTKDFIKREWPMWLLIIIPTIFSIINWNNFPDRIPTHWGVDGEVDDYSGKWAVFLGPLVATGMYLLMIAIPKIDPRKKNYDLFKGAYWVIRIGLVLMMSILGIVTDLVSLGYHLDVGMIVILSVLGLFLLMGNQFGKIRPNYFVGIRTAWTISNEEVWMKTHRFGGRVWVIGSLLMMILVWFIPMKTFAILFLPYIIIIAIIPIIYSYIIHKKITSQNQSTKKF